MYEENFGQTLFRLLEPISRSSPFYHFLKFRFIDKKDLPGFFVFLAA